MVGPLSLCKNPLGTAGDSFTDTGKLFELDASGLLILLAGDKAGETIYGESNIAIEHGIYDLYTTSYKDKNGELDIYRFRHSNKTPWMSP